MVLREQPARPGYRRDGSRHSRPGRSNGSNRRAGRGLAFAANVLNPATNSSFYFSPTASGDATIGGNWVSYRPGPDHHACRVHIRFPLCQRERSTVRPGSRRLDHHTLWVNISASTLSVTVDNSAGAGTGNPTGGTVFVDRRADHSPCGSPGRESPPVRASSPHRSIASQAHRPSEAERSLLLIDSRSRSGKLPDRLLNRFVVGERLRRHPLPVGSDRRSDHSCPQLAQSAQIEDSAKLLYSRPGGTP